MPKKINKLFLIIFFVALMFSCITKVEVAYADIDTLNPTHDTFYDDILGTSYNGKGGDTLRGTDGDIYNCSPYKVNWVGTITDTINNGKASIRFDLSHISGTITGAELRIYVPAVGKYFTQDPATTDFYLYSSNNDAWDETAQELPATSTLLQKFNTVTEGDWNSFNVTNFIKSEYSGNKIASFVLNSNKLSEDDIFAFSSDEDYAEGSYDYRPQLVITYNPRSASIAATTEMTEGNLDTNSIDVTLSGDTLVDASLDKANFTLNNAPAGVTVESVTYTDSTHCTVNLAYDGTDFDSNVTNLGVTIKGAELAGNADLTASNQLSITAKVEPTVSSVAVPSNGTYKAGYNLDFTVNFNKIVTVTGTPQLSLNIGGVTRKATYESGLGTSALVFRYTVQAGDSDNDGIIVNGLELNGGTIKDSIGNDATLTLNGVGSTTGVKVDTIAPTINSSTLAESNEYIDITFSEGIYGENNGTTALTAAKLALTFTQNGGTATNVIISSIKKNDNTAEGSASALTGGETTVRVFLNVAGAPSGLETIEIKPANASSIYDKEGNALSIAQTTGVKTLNDKVAPAFNPATGTSIDSTFNTVTLTFSENILNALGNIDSLKNAVTFAPDGVNYNALGINDTVTIVSGKLIVTFESSLTGNTNKIKIAGNSLKDECGNLLTELITTNSIVAQNADQGAPTETLVPVAPTVYGLSDGKITGTTTAMEYKLSADIAWTPVTGAEITGLAAGTYNVRYAAKTGFNAGTAVNVVIANGANAEQGAPTETLIPIAPSVYGLSDGKITGTTTAMEYKLSTATEYIVVTGAEITGLAAGTYNVRYAAKTGFNAGTAVNVVIANGPSADQGAPYIPPTPEPQPKPEEITVDVTDGTTDNVLSETTIQRTTEADGTKKDEVQYTADEAQMTVEKLKETGKDTARLVIPDSKDEVSEAEIKIPAATITIMAQGNINLQIDTENARINVPKDSIKNLDEGLKEDLFFRVVPIKKEQQRKEIIERAKQEEVVKQVAKGSDISVVGRPMTIETNMSQRAVDIVLPLKDVTLPATPKEREEFFSKIGIFIEHSDGEKVLTKGEVVEYKNGVLGIKFRITKFSTFTIIKLNEGEFDENGNISSNGGYGGPKTFMTDKEITITFNKDLNEKTLTKDSIYIEDSTGKKVETVLKYNAKGKTVAVTPLKYYNTGETYYLCVTDKLLSTSGKSVSKKIKYSFNIGNVKLDKAAQHGEYREVSQNKVWTVKLNEAIDLSKLKNANIRVYDENCNEVEVAISNSTDNKTISITPKNAYQKGKSYYLFVYDIISEKGAKLKEAQWIKYTIIKN